MGPSITNNSSQAFVYFNGDRMYFKKSRYCINQTSESQPMMN